MIYLGAPFKWSDRRYSLPKPKWWQFVSVDKTYDCRGGLCTPVYAIRTVRIFWIIPLIQTITKAER